MLARSGLGLYVNRFKSLLGQFRTMMMTSGLAATVEVVFHAIENRLGASKTIGQHIRIVFART